MFEKELKNNICNEFMRAFNTDKDIFDYIIKMAI